jgi:hypothetical protein
METPWYLNYWDDKYQKKIVSKKRDKKQHKFPLRNCTKCKKVWQNDWFSSKKKLVHYDDMPKYGITKETCDKCKKKDECLYESR